LSNLEEQPQFSGERAMPKNRKSNKESKKKPLMTMKEKREAKKSKNEDNVFLVNENTARRPKTASGTNRP
jgi:hypothetical protein